MIKTLSNSQPLMGCNTKIAVIGAGVAGSTIALRFAELGIDTTLIEQGPSLVNGPPFCHLHAGGNLYREISDEQCLTLLKQSIDTVKVYPSSVNIRPTIIALPKTDNGEPQDLVPRLEKLRNRYSELVSQDIRNKVLGDPQNYFRFYSLEEVTALVGQPIPNKATKDSDWLIAFANHTNLKAIKFPILVVQEYGLSAFRFAAIANLAINNLSKCQIQTNSRVIDMLPDAENSTWLVSTKHTESLEVKQQTFDYVVNACGFKSGEIDDMLSAKRERMVEFKAAYVAHWPQYQGLWPEVIFHGERGTPNGMAQLTPYPDGYFQLHGMTQDITLFDQGLVASSTQSSQPKLAPQFIKKINDEWPEPLIKHRTLGSIEHMSQFIPAFISAEVAAKPLFGAQQIPGGDPELRAADVSFHGTHYARAEIVKASSALAAADAILLDLVNSNLVDKTKLGSSLTEHYFPVTLQCSAIEVEESAMELAKKRNYPEALAKNI